MDKMTCPRCRGAGTVELSPHLMVLLLWLRVNGRATVAQAHRALRLPSGVTAMNNRMEALRELGLVTRPTKDGKAWVYEATEAGKLLPPSPAATAAPAAAGDGPRASPTTTAARPPR